MLRIVVTSSSDAFNLILLGGTISHPSSVAESLGRRGQNVVVAGAMEGMGVTQFIAVTGDDLDYHSTVEMIGVSDPRKNGHPAANNS